MKTETKMERWVLADRIDDMGYRCGINVETDNGGYIVCRIPDGAIVNGGHAFPNQLQNAHLIAAAPELLEALKALERDLHWSKDKGWEIGPMDESKGGKFEMMKAAIAKAEGR